MRRKNVLIIDDSALMRKVLSDIINESDKYIVKYQAANGKLGLDIICENHDIDVVFLDINMPVMGGLQLLEELNKKNICINIIIFSSIASQYGYETIKALELGALDFIKKPDKISQVKEDDFKEKVLEMLLIACKVKARPKDKEERAFPKEKIEVSEVTTNFISKRTDWKCSGKTVVALACSTGGPKSLQMVIPYLPKNLNAPVVLVQHMPVGFTESLAKRLNELSAVTVEEAADGTCIEKGHVYIAKGGNHMEVFSDRGKNSIKLNQNPPINALRPCANVMYNSLCNSDYDEVICVVLTGMGADGKAGIEELKKHKKVHVIAQDEESCVVYGMPRAVNEAGLSDEILPLNKIAMAITDKAGVL